MWYYRTLRIHWKKFDKKIQKKVFFYPFKGDITNKKQILRWVKSKKFNYLIHLATIVPIKEVNSNRKKGF